jgi:nucleoside phosphorylase
MILILGNSSDSLIYLKNMLRYSEEVKEEGELVSYLGKIYGQDVCIAETGLTSYRSELIASNLISKYHPYIVIYIGDGVKLSQGLALGDILMGTFVQIIDVNELNKDPSCHLYEVPGFTQVFQIQDNLVRLFSECSAHVDVLSGRTGMLLSSNTWPSDLKALNFDAVTYGTDHHSEVAFDSEVGGLALACAFYSVPLFPIVTVASDIAVKGSDLERKKTVLKNAVDIGKTVVSFIVQMSSDEKLFIRSDFGNDLKTMGLGKIK